MQRSNFKVKTPVRICHAGEDLDWLGYKCCCTAIDLVTEVKLLTKGKSHSSIFFDNVWRILCEYYNITKKKPRVEVSSEAPIGSGLSTSSSLTLALIKAGLMYAGIDSVTADELANVGYEVEFRISQGGGMDQLTIARGGTLLMQGQDSGLPFILDETSWPSDFAVILLDSCQKKETTPHIQTVHEQLRTGDIRLKEYIAVMEKCAVASFDAIMNGNLLVLQGSLNQAHLAMRDLQYMSTRKLEAIRDIALSVGCGGVKLSGAGGGGCLFSVVQKSERKSLVINLKRAFISCGLDAQVLIPEVCESNYDKS